MRPRSATKGESLFRPVFHIITRSGYRNLCVFFIRESLFQTCYCFLLTRKNREVSNHGKMKPHEFVLQMTFSQFFHYPQVCPAQQNHHADHYNLCRTACMSECHKIVIIFNIQHQIFLPITHEMSEQT